MNDIGESFSPDIVEDVEPLNKLEFAGAVFTLTNAAVGSSLLAIPFALKKVGIIPCIILILALVFVARFIEWRLIFKSRETGSPTTSSFLISSLGKKFGLILSFLVSIALFAGLVSLLTIIGDLVTPIMQHWFGKSSFFSNRTYLTFFVSFFFMVPVATLPKVDMLRYTSFLTVLSLLFMTVSVIFRFFTGPPIDHSKIIWWNWSWEFIRGPPIIWYNTGFIWMSVVTVSPKARQFTKPRVVAIFGCVSTITTILMLLLGLAGYLTFLDTTNGNILTNYAISDPLIGVCRVLVAIVAVCSYPLFNMPFRENIFLLISEAREFIKKYMNNSKTLQPLHVDDVQIMALSENNKTAVDEANGKTDQEEDPKYLTPVNNSEIEYETDNTHKVELETIYIELDEKESNISDLKTASDQPKFELLQEPKPTSIKLLYLQNFLQSLITWGLAFLLSYIIPDITVAIGFVGWCLSPLYDFFFPAAAFYILSNKDRHTIYSCIGMLILCAYFECAGFGSMFLPPNVISPPRAT